MNLYENSEIQNYIREVCSQIRNKRVHKEITAELNAHFKQKINEHLKIGQKEEDALKESIMEMGSSKYIGAELNKVHKCNVEWSVIALSTILVLVNIFIMLFFAINGDFDKIYGNHSYFLFNRNILWSVIGLAAFLLASFIDYRKIKQYSGGIYMVTLILLSYSVLSNPSRIFATHLSFFGLGVNVAYVSNILFIVSLAGIYDKYQWNNRKNFINGVVLGLVPLLLIVGTKSFSTFIIYGITLILLIFLSKAGIKIISLFVSLEVLLMLITKIGFNDIFGFLNRWNDIEGDGYIYNQLKTIRQSFRLIGKGLFFDNHNLPEFYGDVMFSSIVYSFGWIAGAVIVILMIAFLIRLVKAALSIKNSYGKSLILGISFIFGIQFIWNILFNLGFAIGGVSLPWISYNGSSMFAHMLAVGIITNVYRGRSISNIELI